jgi:Sec-independent protein translocase protein TatA
MDILGIGGWELVAVILIMLIVAGPKRMIQWSYTAGKYVAMLRKMWAETAQQIQKEFDDAGVDVKVPKDLPTRATIGKEISRAMLPVTKPIQDSLNETKSEIDSVKEEAGIKPKPATNPKMVPQPKTTPKPVTAETPETPPAPAINSAATEPVPSNGNGNGTSAPDFGTWSKKP